MSIDSRGQTLFQGKYDVKNEYDGRNEVMRSSLVTCLDQLFLRKIHSLDPNYQWLLISVYQTKTCLDLAWIWTCNYKGVATTTVVTGLWFHRRSTVKHHCSQWQIQCVLHTAVCFVVSISPFMIVVSLACAYVACVAQNHRHVRFESVVLSLILVGVNYHTDSKNLEFDTFIINIKTRPALWAL